MKISVDVWWVVAVVAVAAIFFIWKAAGRFIQAAIDRALTRVDALTESTAQLAIKLENVSNRLEGAENIGGYLAGLQRVAEAQVAAVTKLSESVDAFGGLVLATPPTSGPGRVEKSPVQEVSESAATLEYLVSRYRNEDGMNEEEARHRALLDAELSGGTPGY